MLASLSIEQESLGEIKYWHGCLTQWVYWIKKYYLLFIQNTTADVKPMLTDLLPQPRL